MITNTVATSGPVKVLCRESMIAELHVSHQCSIYLIVCSTTYERNVFPAPAIDMEDSKLAYQCFAEGYMEYSRGPTQ